MDYYMPTKVIAKKNCVVSSLQEIRNYGTSAFIVTGKHSSKKNGSLDDITQTLESLSFPYCIFDKIEENPSIETIEAASEYGKEKRVDVIIGVGGGSPMDAAKAISLLIKNPEETKHVLYETKKLEAFPVIAIPTTAGTGSEVTPYAILTLHERKTKASMTHRIYPVLALLDGKYLKMQSKQLRMYTAMDALAHLIESYLNTNATDFSRMFSEYGLRKWEECFLELTKDTVSSKIYQKMLEVSCYAGMAIAHTGTSLPHGMSYYFTYHKNIPHGAAVGIFLASYLELVERKNKQAVTFVLECLKLKSIRELKEWICDGIEVNIVVGEEELQMCIEDIMKNTAKLKNYPYVLDKQELEGMYRESIQIIK